MERGYPTLAVLGVDQGADISGLMAVSGPALFPRAHFFFFFLFFFYWGAKRPDFFGRLFK